jgi:hypothetical protein
MERTFFLGVYPGIGGSQLEHIGSTFERFMQGQRAG